MKKTNQIKTLYKEGVCAFTQCLTFFAQPQQQQPLSFRASPNPSTSKLFLSLSLSLNKLAWELILIFFVGSFITFSGCSSGA
jgi:hypothetical protein